MGCATKNRDAKGPRLNPSSATLNELQKTKTKPSLPAPLLGSHGRGITNLGSTCYLSASLQLLRACSPLRSTLTQTPLPYAIDIGRVPVTDQPHTRGVLQVVGDLQDLFREMEDATMSGPYNPRLLHDSLSLSIDSQESWAPDQQQDAKEAIQMLLNAVHTVTNKAEGHVDNSQYSQDIKVVDAASDHWKNVEAYQSQSAGQGPFLGQGVTTLKCLRCKVFKPRTFEVFTMLVVHIPHEIIATAAGRAVSLQHLLRSRYHLDNVEDTICENCPPQGTSQQKKPFKGPMEQAYRITRAPAYLMIQLCRRVAGATGQHEKISHPVEFPTIGLNLYEYMHPDSRREDSAIYDCKAGIHHQGTSMRAGHYVACLHQLDQDGRLQWIEYNDEVRTAVVPSSVWVSLNSDSLILLSCLD